jgi:hypothetical protein
MKFNKHCPSYCCGDCVTFPTPYSVKCGGEQTKDCKWLEFDFEHITYEQYCKQENKGA